MEPVQQFRTGTLKEAKRRNVASMSKKAMSEYKMSNNEKLQMILSRQYPAFLIL